MRTAPDYPPARREMKADVEILGFPVKDGFFFKTLEQTNRFQKAAVVGWRAGDFILSALYEKEAFRSKERIVFDFPGGRRQTECGGMAF